MRLRHDPTARERLLAYPFSYEKETVTPGAWQNHFPQNQPLHAEFGSGKGQFITTLAARHPENNYIAVELHAEVLLKVAQKIEEQGLTNVVCLLANLMEVDRLFAPDELSRIYLNFSDPWPKKRHAKRRLTHETMIQHYQWILAPEGEIHIKTDNQDFFEFTLNQLATCDMKLQNITLDLHRNTPEGMELVMTEYEEKFVAKGQPIFRCEARQRTSDSK
ncbi:tRNA (guanosine(46)-N7)-methyltransferase TrmB [Rubeoparvulum massiliense]|uniref:tRNA (guanosine(46)-N7)-methyltransferase TrmB n=1 Tax=Rubeoparvulum massiliense TaxID=1631346 RepID=UPI00065E4B36|nr:tRNA (guanosine(46)-N7)-methyltransferase TrmB [Rubeoparvulum massiliense]